MISVLFGAIAILWTTTACAAFTIPSSTHGTMEPWNQIATIDMDGSIICQDCREVVAKYDLSSPREWMEFLEATEGHGGAYTVIRCDYKQASWRVWGRDFHMKRLCQSYCALMHVNEKQLSNITETTNVILDSLLEHASLILSTGADANAMYTVMVTILWQNGTRDASTLVRGHVCCSGTAVFDYNVSLPEAQCPFKFLSVFFKSCILDPVTHVFMDNECYLQSVCGDLTSETDTLWHHEFWWLVQQYYISHRSAASHRICSVEIWMSAGVLFFTWPALDMMMSAWGC